MGERRAGNLRILMTADTLGGVWDYSLELAKQLARFSTETVLATMGRPPTPEQRHAAAEIPGLLLRESGFKLEWMPDAGEDLRLAGEWLLHLEDDFRPDLIHLNGYVHGTLPWRAPVVVVAHSCVQSWWQAVKGEKAPEEWDAYARRVAEGLGAAAAVVAPTRSLLETIQGIYGPVPRPTVIWNGRDPRRYAACRKGRFILSAGRLWDEAKNLSALEAIGCELEWPVISAGEWRRPDGTGAPPANVTALGVLPSEQMVAWMGKAPIYALPARYEPFGLSVLEAALSGCALVLGDIPTLRELWDGCALFVPPDDHGRLLSALQGLISNPTRLAELSLAARRKGLVYTAEKMALAYSALYADLLHPSFCLTGSPKDAGGWTTPAALKL